MTRIPRHGAIAAVLIVITKDRCLPFPKGDQSRNKNAPVVRMKWRSLTLQKGTNLPTE
jgi:hypothetical protein